MRSISRLTKPNEQKAKIFFAVFGFMVLYYLIVANDGNLLRVTYGDGAYAFHALDFSMGFHSQILPGGLYHWLVGVYTEKAVSIYLNVLYFLLWGIVSFEITKLFSRFQSYKTSCLVFGLLVLTGPFSLAGFTKTFGTYDFYWAFFFFAACLFLKNRILKYLTPIFIVMMIMSHYGAALHYFPSLLLLLLFFAAIAEEKRERNEYLVLFAVSLLAGVGVTLFLVSHEGDSMFYSREEFCRILTEERNAKEIGDFYYTFFRSDWIENPYGIQDALNIGEETSGIVRIIKVVLYHLKVTLTVKFQMPIPWLPYLLSLPVITFVCILLFGYVKSTKFKARKGLALLALCLFFFIIVATFVLSTDVTRWFVHAFLGLFTFLFAVLYYDYAEGFEKVQRWMTSAGSGVALFFVLCYSLLVMPLYD